MVNFAALVARTGKEQGTQLAHDEVDSGALVKVGQLPIQQPDFDYGSMKLLANIYTSMDQLKLTKNINDALIVGILNDMGKVFLNPESKTALMTGQGGKLPPPAKIENCNLREFRGHLETLSNDPNIAKDEAKVKAIKTTLTALDENNLIQLIELADIYQALGKDIVIPEEKVINLVDNLSKDGICSPDEVQAILNQFVAGNNEGLRPALIAHTMGPEIIVRQDGRIATKRSMMFTVEPQVEIERMEVVAYGNTGLVVLVPRGTVVTPPPAGGSPAEGSPPGLRGGFNILPSKDQKEAVPQQFVAKEYVALDMRKRTNELVDVGKFGPTKTWLPKIRDASEGSRGSQDTPTPSSDTESGTNLIAQRFLERKWSLADVLYTLTLEKSLQGQVHSFNADGVKLKYFTPTVANSLRLQVLHILNSAEHRGRTLTDMEIKFIKDVVELHVDIPLQQLQKTLNIAQLAGLITNKTVNTIYDNLKQQAKGGNTVKLYYVRKVMKESKKP
ncbi:Dynein light chain LC6, flagellar outer arm [Trichuris trichiura]|uniref:Dynein light chain LC6, flagellar outer arm n=1 Tax=Trichuris trichiura TaxID=36087 RepID=A0A077ZJK8_TRITR|nr:Dynein light chain LC6, flagellar outer arm [Trichuris trichiura]